MSRYKYHVFVCENQRPPDDPKGCCAAKGASSLLEGLRERVKAAGLQAKIRINSSGCLANCARGSTVVIYPDAVWYSFVKVEDIPDIFEQHLINGIPVKRLLDPVFHSESTRTGTSA